MLTRRSAGPSPGLFASAPPHQLLAGAAAGVSILVGVTIGLGEYLPVLAVPALLFTGFAVLRPHAFLGVSLLLYSLLQVGLVQTEVVQVGQVAVNASQLYVLVLLSLLSLGVMAQQLGGQLVLPAPLPSMVAQMALAVWLVLCLTFSPHLQNAVGSVARNVADLVVFYVAYALGSQPHRVRWIMTGVVGTAIIAAVSSVVQSSVLGAAGVAGVGDEVFRASGTFGGSVQTGTICFAGLAFFVSQLPALGGRRRWLCLAGVALAGLGMLSTLSRTGILGGIIFAFLLAAGRARHRRGSAKYLAYAAVTLATITLAIHFTPEESIRSRTADLPFLGEGRLSSPTSGSGRSLIWKTTLLELGDNTAGEWLVGHGVATVSETLLREIHVPVGAHNSYLQILYDTGIVGLLLYLSGILLILRDVRAAERSVSAPLDDSLRIWFCYLIAYFLSTEMFNAYVYVLGPRFLTFMVLGLYLARARSSANPPRRHGHPARSPTVGVIGA